MMNYLYELFDLHNGEEDKQKTLENVKNNITFTGANLWILACAVIIASVGLNVNSTAVIIGAMLISPLMGPIVGAGFALGIFDFDLLKKSLINLLIATIASLIVSTIYFYLSPFKQIQSELLARTSPNIYDILIAFFGGLVGVIAITRVEKGNPIPGVAIATALMPPLCTAGYGLATGNFKFFFGALFLYTINCVFICISTYSIVKYLQYPVKQEIDVLHQKRVKYGVTAIIIIMLLPSAYFAYSLYKQQEFKQNVDLFLENEFEKNGNTIVYKKTNYSTSSSIIEVAFLYKNYTTEEIKQLNEDLKKYNLTHTKLIIKQDSVNNINALRNDILNEVYKKDVYLEEKEIELLKLKNENQTIDSKKILEEIKIIFPSIQSISFVSQNINSSDTTYSKTIFSYHTTVTLSETDKLKLSSWLQKRLTISNLEIINP